MSQSFLMSDNEQDANDLSLELSAEGMSTVGGGF